MNEEPSLDLTLAVIVRGPVAGLERILATVSHDPGVRLIYRELSAMRLRVVEEPTVNGSGEW